MEVGPEDSRGLVDLLIQQVEFANVIIVNKVDTVDAATVTRVKATLARLNTKAEILTATRSAVPLTSILNTKRFSMAEAESAPGWLVELRGEHIPESEEYGISSFVYRRRRPFHPQRLADALADGSVLKRVVRSKGFLWLATRQSTGGVWEHAGRVHRVVPGGPWYAAVHYAMWPPSWRSMRHEWLPEPVGDRHTELVIIGMSHDQASITAALDAACLTDEEFDEGPAKWAEYPDPFTAWPAFTGPAPQGKLPDSIVAIIKEGVEKRVAKEAADAAASEAKRVAAREAAKRQREATGTTAQTAPGPVTSAAEVAAAWLATADTSSPDA